ncbi:HD-GYP domain (HD superfamily hydrolase) [Dissulfuribacter thermophilus]|uniref:HD-GYP domain (HD superfamily hydrolase) n=1 Tax=Dissulfuribacter thermophilus TaxID=1156395 RepID=A0A1B9F4E3_9BACT|nr:HDOD domain-containing protein [Dissulfuribacter thermophilus]OCC14694.1 HD-GYP domain (HD superfamily hydrolase) [Dissulfuribacter thermophilus]
MQEYIQNLIKNYTQNGLPCFSDTVLRLASLDPDDEISIEKLSAIILEDIGLTARVIQTVNSFYYRRTGQEVTSVTQAVVLLGFNTIREIALNMAVLDLAEKKGDKVLLGLILASFIGAHLAQELLDNESGLNKESMMVAGLFFSLGRIILALDSPETYAAFEKFEKSADPKDKKQALAILKELGRAIATVWNLPPFIKENLEGNTNTNKKIPFVLEKAHAFGRAFTSQNISPSKAKSILQAISQRTGHEIPVLLKRANEAVDKAMGLSAAFKQVISETCANDLIGKLGDKSEVYKKTISDTRGDTPEDRYITLLTQLSSSIAQRRLGLNQIFLLATETLFRGIGVDRVLLLLLTKEKDLLVPRHGIGRGITELKECIKISFPPRIKSIKEAFQENRETILTWNTILKRISKINDIQDSAICALSPIIVDSNPIGCFIIDRAISSNKIEKLDILRLKAIKDLVVMATLNR